MLVTGHNGYLGSVMVPVLRAGGHQVVGLDSDLFADVVLGPEPPPVEAIRCDLRDVERGDLEGFDAVIHLAALSNDPLGDFTPRLTHEINHHASVRLATLAKAAGVQRFLYASSCSVYGAHGGSAPVDETCPMEPLTPYAVSKVRVEADLVALADDVFTPVLLRNATAYGFSPRLRCDLVVNDLVGHAVLDGVVRVLSDGTPWRPLVHVEDIAAAFLAALEAPREVVHAEAFNVGSDRENYQVRDIAEVVAAAVPGSAVAVAGTSSPDARSYRVDFSKMASALPAATFRWTLDRGAAELADAYRRHGLTREAFTERFRRLGVLRQRIQEGTIAPDLRPLRGARPR